MRTKRPNRVHIYDNLNYGICVHDSHFVATDKGSLVHGFIYRNVSGVALWQNALPLIHCRLGFYLSFIFVHIYIYEYVNALHFSSVSINRFKNKVLLFQTQRRLNGNHLPGKSTRTTGNPEHS